ncbi:MAG: hypothetical protein V4687_13190 [Bacteroidota bacterium]
MIIYNNPVTAYYSPSIFIRAGLLLLTIVIALSVIGLLSMMVGALFFSSSLYLFFLGISSYITLELTVRKYHHYRSGVDDALLWISGGLILGGLVLLTDSLIKGNEGPVISLFVLLLSFYLTLRFADVLMTAVCYSSLISFIFFSWERIPVWGMDTMPFLIIIVAAGSYFIAVSYNKKTEQPAYINCLTIVILLALFVFYAAGNYFVVQKLSPATQSVPITGGPSIKPLPLALFFWCWTVLIPIGYIAVGLKRKDVILLRMGLMLLAVTIFTIRYYYHIIDIEWALTIGGLVLIGVAYWAHRYLKEPRHGLTAEDLSDSNKLDKLIGESLVISETVDPAPQIAADNRFGGGSFGGGGASSNF